MDAPREMSGVLTGADSILRASDYRHPECRAGIVAELMAGLEALPEADQRRIAGENAVAAYGLPVTVPG